MMWGYDGAWTWGGMIMGTVSMIVLLALLGGFFLLVSRWQGRSFLTASSTSSTLSARQILEQRYARGEIDEATFQRMQDQLKAPPTS